MKSKHTILSSPEALFKEAKAIKSTSVEKALLKAQEALLLAQESDGFELQFDIHLFQGRILYNNIGCQYVLLKDYDKAFYYLLKGKEFCIEQKDYRLLSFIYENFGQMYLQEKKKEEAIVSYTAGIEAAEQAKDQLCDAQELEYIRCYNLLGLAKVYLEADELSEIPKFIQEVYDRSTAMKLRSCWSEAAIIEGSMFLKQQEEEAFITLFEKASVFCTEHALHSDQVVWLRKMIDLCESQHKYKEALDYSKRLIANKADRELKTKAVNITKVLENKEMEILALENRNREMQLQRDQLEQLAYIVAHDLKTPLSNISNFIGLFSKQYGDKVDEENKYYLDFVESNSKQLHLMLDELLRYMTVRKIKKEASYCDVENLITKISKKYEQEISVRQGVIEYEALPKVKMHRNHLEMILDRMIGNGVKFSKKDQPFKMSIEIKDNSEEYQFLISDNGIGIKEEYREKIFDLFKRLDKINYKGLGVGLAICKKVINIYGGKIEVSRNDWGGTTFKFNIPKVERFE